MGDSSTTAVVPLVADAHGALRVGSTRVTLESIVTAFRAGATAEDIAQQFPAVRLADVYQVIAHYLNNVTEIEDYLRRRRAEAAAVEREVEARFDPAGIRGRLIARRHPASR